MNETRPLLGPARDASEDSNLPLSAETRYERWRRETRHFLSSKWGHYLVIILVSFDVTGIFFDFLLKLYVCDHTCGKGQKVPDTIPRAVSALGIISLTFSCLFVVELSANIWASGLQFFRSWFRCLDAAVIVVGLIIDISLSGVEEEAGSLIIVLRFWRVFKIIEELSAGASEEMDELRERLEKLQLREFALQEQIVQLKSQHI